MLEDLKKEMQGFLKDVKENVKNKEELIYIETRASKLFEVMLDEINKIIDFKEEKLNAIIKKQEIEGQKLEELKERLDNVYEDIYEEDGDNFLINCPYCGSEFDAEVDEECTEIKCPECQNLIELDWNGNPDDDRDLGCNRKLLTL